MTKQHKFIIAAFCIIKLTLHLIADSHSGFQRDELLHIEAGKHLAWGYIEFPPLIGLLAFIQNLFNSNAVYIHHLFAHIASLLIIIYVAKIVIALGGKNQAIFLVLLSILIAPGFGRSQQLFQPVVFSQLFWVLSFYQLLLYGKYLDKKYLLYLTIFTTIGLLFKYDLLFFIFGLPSLFFFQRTRAAIVREKIWLYIAVAFIALFPNIHWQYTNNFPALQMFSRLYETQLNHISRIENLKNLLLAINPVTIVLIIPAVYYMLKLKHTDILKPLVYAIVFSFLLLVFFNGKSYYFLPIMLTILPFGGLFWEQLVFQKKKWAIYPIAAILLLGILLIPFGMPVYSFQKMLSSIQKYETKKVDGGKFAIAYDEYYSNDNWKQTMIQLKKVYDSLPENEKSHTLIWGKHYAQAGAINLFGKEYNLPKAFSYHGSFYSWAPKGKMPNTLLALSYQIGDYFNPFFEEMLLIKTIYNPYADNEEELYQRIYICKKPKYDFEKMKALFNQRIFE